MQEDLENRTVTLMVSSSKFTGRTMKSAILHFLSYSKHKVQEHKNVVPHGKQSVKQLTGQHEGVMNLPVGDDVDMRAFDRVARKYSIDYAVRKLPEKEGESKYSDLLQSPRQGYADGCFQRMCRELETERQGRKAVGSRIAEHVQAQG